MKHKKAAVFGAILFVVASLSCAAGYLSSRDFNRTPIVIEACSDAAHAALGPAPAPTAQKENPR